LKSLPLVLSPPKRIHIAIMKKSWGLTEKILSGEKTIESWWYQNRYPPWGKISTGDIVYFKNSGEPVKLKAEVKKVLQFKNLTPEKVTQILKKYGKDGGIDEKDFEKYFNLFKNKKYCLLIFLEKVKKIKPFAINKTGFGAMAAWLTVVADKFEKIKMETITDDPPSPPVGGFGGQVVRNSGRD